MPVISRDDCPGRIHHIYIRGINRRAIFDSPVGVRIFLALLAKQVRLGRVRILAYCFMTNHVHLIVESCTGELSEVLGLVSNLYCKIYNSNAERTGSLFDGRFKSKPVLEDGYLLTLLRYIELNPVAAGLCDHPAEYAFGSARAWHLGRVGRWLDTEWFKQRMVPKGASQREAASIYLDFVSRGMSMTRWAEFDEDAFLVRPGRRRRPVSLDRRVSDWLRQRNILADGVNLHMNSRSASEVQGVVEIWRERLDAVPLRFRCESSGSELAQVALLVGLTGMRLRAVAALLNTSVATLARRRQRYARALTESSAYAACMEAVFRKLLGRVVAERDG